MTGRTSISKLDVHVRLLGRGNAWPLLKCAVLVLLYGRVRFTVPQGYDVGENAARIAEAA